MNLGKKPNFPASGTASAITMGAKKLEPLNCERLQKQFLPADHADWRGWFYLSWAILSVQASPSGWSMN